MNSGIYIIHILILMSVKCLIFTQKHWSLSEILYNFKVINNNNLFCSFYNFFLSQVHFKWVHFFKHINCIRIKNTFFFLKIKRVFFIVVQYNLPAQNKNRLKKKIYVYKINSLNSKRWRVHLIYYTDECLNNLSLSFPSKFNRVILIYYFTKIS